VVKGYSTPVFTLADAAQLEEINGEIDGHERKRLEGGFGV